MPLAFILESRDVPAVVGPLIILLIPIIAILTAHQRRMAELIHGRGPRAIAPVSTEDYRVAAMGQELAELRDTVRRQQIELDDVRERARTRVELEGVVKTTGA